MMTWCVMGSTTSCNGSCFQWAIPPPDESRAMRKASVPSTRAISASARRRSAEGGLAWRASEAAAGSPRERSCNRDLVMDMGSHERRHDGRDEEPATAGALFAKGVDARAVRGLQHVVALLAEPARELRADQASPASDDNLHDFPPFCRPPMGLAVECSGTMRPDG